MSKKFTIMFYDADRYGKAKSITVTKRLLIVASVCVVVSIIGLVATLAVIYKNSKYIESLEMISGENTDIINQMANYSNQLDQLNLKVASLDELENKVREIISSQKGEQLLKPVAVGGKEIDVLRGYFAVTDRREKEFFDSLNESLSSVSSEIDKRETSLSDLVKYLEEQRLTMLSTPTIWPVRGWISSQFGFRTSPFSGRRVFHEGLDIAARYGSDVKAAAKGVIVFSGQKAGYGYIVTIDHGYGYLTRYAHNSRLTVQVGDKVQKGDTIAKVGTSGRSTGPHVHYEVLVNGIPVNPLKFIVDETEIN